MIFIFFFLLGWMLNLFCSPVFQFTLRGGCESPDNMMDSWGLICSGWRAWSCNGTHKGSTFFSFIAVCMVPGPAQLLSIGSEPQCIKCAFNCMSNLFTNFLWVLNQITLQTLCLVMCLTQHLHTKLPNEHVQLWQLDMWIKHANTLALGLENHSLYH